MKLSEKRVAALDIGTNTVLMLIIASAELGHCSTLLEKHAIARLGAGVDATGVITEAGIDRLRAILTAHVASAKELGVTAFSAVGTSALRDARNRLEVVERIRREFAIEIKIITGAQEAALTFRGGLAGLPLAENSNSIAVLDIGGGSTEIAFGSRSELVRGKSLEIGAVRMTERYFPDSFRTKVQIEAARKNVREVLLKNITNEVALDELIGVAGTPTSLAAMAQSLAEFDVAKIQGFELSLESVQRLREEISSIDVEAMKARYPVVNSSRADILLAGSIILEQAMIVLEMDRVRVSTRGLRYGVALQALEAVYGVPMQDWEFIV